MKSLEIIDDFVKYYDELLYGILRDHAPCCEGDLEEIMERRNKLLIIKKDLEILELVRGKSFFFHLSKQELKKVNKWLEDNEE